MVWWDFGTLERLHRCVFKWKFWLYSPLPSRTLLSHEHKHIDRYILSGASLMFSEIILIKIVIKNDACTLIVAVCSHINGNRWQDDHGDKRFSLQCKREVLFTNPTSSLCLATLNCKLATPSSKLILLPDQYPQTEWAYWHCGCYIVTNNRK